MPPPLPPPLPVQHLGKPSTNPGPTFAAKTEPPSAQKINLPSATDLPAADRSRSKQARPRRRLLAVAVSGSILFALVVVAIFALRQNGTPFASLEDRERFLNLLQTVSEPLGDKLEEFQSATTFEEEYKTIHQIVDAMNKGSANHAFLDLCNCLRPPVAKCAATLDRIAEVEHKKPTDVDTTLSAIVGLWEFLQTNKDASQSENNEHLKNAWSDSQDLRQRLQAEMNLPQLRQQYREARKELCDMADHIFEVATQANGRAVQSMASGPTLVLCDGFADSVNRSFADDRLRLTNHTGQTLHRCILLVSCESGNRQLAHLHYKDAWASDQTFFTAYNVGNDSYNYPNALDETLQIRVKLVSSELQVEEVFPYTESARNQHLQNSLANFHFSMSYLPYQKFFGFESHLRGQF